MGETEPAAVTNGAQHANSSASTDSSTPVTQDDKPPIPRPPSLLTTNNSYQLPALPDLEKQATYHTLSADTVAEQLRSNLYHGLTSHDAASRLARDGPNSIKGAKGVSVWEIFLQQVANALTVILIAVAALSFAIQDYVEGGVVLAVILLNIVVG